MRLVGYIPASAIALAAFRHSVQAQSDEVCWLCSNKGPPCFLDKVVFVPGQGNMTCAVLGAGDFITEQCPALRALYAEQCGCSNFFNCEPETVSPAPTITARPTMIASSAPSSPSCSICGDSRVCVNSIVQVGTDPAQDCLSLEQDGFNGKIEAYACPIIQRAVAASCGCNLNCQPAPTDAPVGPSGPEPSVPSPISMVPTGNPSSIPSLHPSMHPSSNPTYTPSSEPSIKPSVGPSKAPSGKPSVNMQSFEPSAKTSIPSFAPSSFPTLNPSIYTSIAPTLNPSIYPSIASSIPSFSPSSFPTLNPSMHPSFAATDLPVPSPTTALPSSTYPTPSTTTELPSLLPSVHPSTAPSSENTASPTLLPSQVPSSSPILADTSTDSPSTTPSTEGNPGNGSSSAWMPSLLLPFMSTVAAFHFIIFQ